MIKKKIDLQKKFQQDNDQDQYEDDDENDDDDQSNQNEDNQSSVSKSSRHQDKEYSSLKQLIAKLNEDDHSEDQGIQDYKIGGYHPCHIGEVLLNRYVLIQKLGWGHFSTVWLAKDFKYSTYVAVKLMKSAPHYLQASYDEIQILQKVAKNAYHPDWIAALKQYQKDKIKFDRDDSHVLNLLNAFLYKGAYGNHFCMVFEILGVNLWQILKKNDCKGLPVNIVKEITRQVMMGLDFLNRICRVIHTDLKPENVLICLTDQQLKKIVEDEQLSSQHDFKDRLNYYCQKFNLGPKDQINQQQKLQQPQQQQVISSLQSDNESLFKSQLSTIQSRLLEINQKLHAEDITKNCKKTLRKKLKKLQEERQKQLQSISILLQKKKQSKLKERKGKTTNMNNNRQKKTPRQLFENFKHKISFDNTQNGGLAEGFKVKIADLGNACWEHHHFATQIQTRQYRGPQVLLGSKYNLSADMWSLACMTFQLLTGQLLFNPKKDPNQNFGKNDDHLAQVMELLGRFPKKMSMRGVKAKKYINKLGCLNRIPRLQNWSLKDVMIAKYRFQQNQAQFFESFMVPMLNCYPQKRVMARQLLGHPWLTSKCSQNYLMDYETHQRLRLQRYDVNEQKDELFQYQSQNEDGQEQLAHSDKQQQQQLYENQKVGSINLIDRSYTDLGYIGYGTGIYLQKLDFGPNWQFN